MKNKINAFALSTILLLGAFQVNGQLTPQQVVQQVKRGINIGNTMEPTPGGEGAWGNPPVQERAFDDYKDAGFDAVRIPITWDNHTATTSPYSVSGTWMDRVEQVVDWGLARGLYITIDAHHEGFIKNSYTTPNKARFDSIWSQISIRLKDKSEKLFFEIINEPNGLTAAQVNDLNARVLKIIRKTNPTRIVIFSGNNYAGSGELIATKVPDVNDKYLIGYFHSYNPYPFGLNGVDSNGNLIIYGSDADMNTTKAEFDQVATWSAQKGIPVFIDEFGSQKKCDYNSRMTCYATVVDQALKHNICFFAWDDAGDFPIYQRTTSTVAGALGRWNEIKDILINTHNSSPYKFTFGFTNKSKVVLSWVNRTGSNTNIIVQRYVSTISGVRNVNNPEIPVFTDLAEMNPWAKHFTDTSAVAGKYYFYRLKTTVSDTLVLSYPIYTGLVKTGTTVATAITDAVEKSLFTLYPNPASGQITLQGPANTGNAKVQICDLSGKLIKTCVAKTETSAISLEGLASGTYLFVISTTTATETKQVVIP